MRHSFGMLSCSIGFFRYWPSHCHLQSRLGVIVWYPVTCPFVIIQEFYSNMQRFNYSVPHFTTCVQGMIIVIILDIVSEVLHVPRVAHPDYPGCATKMHNQNNLKNSTKTQTTTICYIISIWLANPQYLPQVYCLMDLNCIFIYSSQLHGIH